MVSLSGDGERTLPHTRTIAVVATTLASMLSRGSSLASQIIVGLFLTEAQVGEYALALGVMGVTGIWRNGGAATYFPSVKPSEFDGSANPLFLWASVCGLATAAATAVFGLSLPYLPEGFEEYRTPALLPLLIILATRSVMHPVALLGRMRLSVEFQFTALARLDAVLAILRVVVTWIVAREGGGALALAVPYAGGTVAEAVGIALMGGFRRSDFAPRFRRLGALWPALAWPLAMAVLNSIRADIIFLAVGLVIPAAALGVYYFAFQFSNQPTMLIGSALQNVLAPMLARDRGSTEAERQSIEGVLASSMLFVPITTMAAASFFPSAERLLWNGKWAGATPSLYWLCAAATYSTVAVLLTGPLVGLQRFKAAAGFELVKMVGMLGGIAAAALMVRTSDAEGLLGMTSVTLTSACISLGMALSALAQILWVARTYRIGRSDTFRHLVFGPGLSALTAISATSLATSLDNSLGIGNDRIGALWQLLTIATTYLILITLAVRFTAESTLRDSLVALPKPVAARVRQLLFMN